MTKSSFNFGLLQEVNNDAKTKQTAKYFMF